MRYNKESLTAYIQHFAAQRDIVTTWTSFSNMGISSIAN